jgi:maleate isomerase
MTLAKNDPGPCILGWIKPDDGVPLPAGAPDYECFRLEPWLRARGVAGVRVRVVTSVAESGHGGDQLLQTGDVRRLLDPARRLVADGAAVLCWACTSGSFAGGVAWAREQVRRVAAETGRPATSASLALVAALGALRATVVDLLSPYPTTLTATLRTFLGDCGIAVRTAAALGCPTGSDSHRLDLREAVAQFASGRAPDSVPLVIPDSAVNTLDLVGDLEARLGRTVITANQATLWHALMLAGVPPAVPAAGRLLAPRAT